MPKLYDVAGQKFGRWTVIGRDLTRPSTGKAYWLCKCDCGTARSVQGSHLHNGLSRSCGCFKLDRAVKHGIHHHRLYRTWRGMLSRCLDESSESFKYYGARGISVCERWRDVALFYADNIEAYQEHAAVHGERNTYIERNDVNGDYEPENVCWTTAVNQARNRRVPKNNRSGTRGVCQTEEENWVAQIDVEGVREYLGTYSTLTEAVEAREDAERTYWRKAGGDR